MVASIAHNFTTQYASSSFIHWADTFKQLGHFVTLYIWNKDNSNVDWSLFTGANSRIITSFIFNYLVPWILACSTLQNVPFFAFFFTVRWDLGERNKRFRYIQQTHNFCTNYFFLWRCVILNNFSIKVQNFLYKANKNTIKSIN